MMMIRFPVLKIILSVVIYDQVIVDFYATWCPPCRSCAVPFGQMSEEYSAKGWIFAKVDVTEAKDVAFRADVSQMPTFKVYVKGTEIQKFVGFQPGNIKELLDGQKPPETKKAE